MKTIKQIADELGVTKQAVHQKRKSKKLSIALQPFTSTVDGVIHISVDGENLIKSAFLQKNTVNKTVNVDVNELSTNLQVALQFAERENEFLRDENFRLREQNDNLTAALIATTERKKWQLRLPWRG